VTNTKVYFKRSILKIIFYFVFPKYLLKVSYFRVQNTILAVFHFATNNNHSITDFPSLFHTYMPSGELKVLNCSRCFSFMSKIKHEHVFYGHGCTLYFYVLIQCILTSNPLYLYCNCN